MSHLSGPDADVDCNCILSTAAELDAVVDAVAQMQSNNDTSFMKLFLDQLRNPKCCPVNSSLLLTDLLQGLFRNSCEQYEVMRSTELNSEERAACDLTDYLSDGDLDRFQQLNVELHIASRRFADLDIRSDASLKQVSFEHVREFHLRSPGAFLDASRNLERLSKSYKRLQSGLDRVLKLTSSTSTLSNHPELEIADQILTAPLDEL